jgi:hypothetical protein
MLFEIRVIGNRWCLDSFALSGAASKALIDRTKLHSLGAWHHAALAYNGARLSNYVDGEMEGSADLQLAPQGQGHSSIGVRIDRRNYFKGAVFEARIKIVRPRLIGRPIEPFVKAENSNVLSMFICVHLRSSVANGSPSSSMG